MRAPIQVATIGYYDASLPKGEQFIMNNAKIIWGGGSKKVLPSAFNIYTEIAEV